MGDTTFSVLLNNTVAIEAGRSDVGFEGEVQSPSFERIVENAPANLMPARSRQYDDIPGGYPQITHMGYLEAGHDIEPGDAIVWKAVATSIAEAVEAGAEEIPLADTGGFEAGETVEIGEGDQREDRTTVAVDGVSVELDEALERSHEENETVTMVRRFEVVEVRTWPGLDHHIEVGLLAV